MTNQRPVTEFDLRAEEFKHPDIKPEDYEFRDDGVIVRKDRWERAVRQLADAVGMSRSFEIGDVVDKIAGRLQKQSDNDKALLVVQELKSSVEACMRNTAAQTGSNARNRHDAYKTIYDCLTGSMEAHGLELE